MVKKTLMFFVSLLLLVSVCFGQTTATGVLKGTVTDPDGAALPGITVILKSPAIVLPQLTTVTNASGQYRFLGLSPGAYEITFMLEGMNTIIRKGIVVSVGKTSTVDVGMTLKSVEESIVVSGKAPTVDRQSTTGVASLDLEFLKSIPVATRSYAAYFDLTPGVTGDTAHGSGEMDNAYLLDGVNMGDPTTGVRYVSFGADIMEEISVQTGGISAEYGSVKGAVVNVVTRSGGNKFSGSASFYYNHESLQADNTKGTDLYDPENPTKTGQKFKMEPVIWLGGPLVKDKLWFFGNLSMTSEETYAPGYPYDEEKEIPADMKQYFPYIKLTFQPNTANKFILSYNFSDLKRNHRFADWNRNVESTVKQTSPTHVFNAHWTRTFGSNFFTNLKFALIDFKMLLHAKQPGTEFWNIDTGLNSGSYWRNEDNNLRDRYQANLDATTFIDNLAGSHELKFGGELQMAKTQWQVITNDAPGLDGGFGYITTYLDNWYWLGYNFNGGFNRKEEMLNYSFFINDTWSITKNLTLNLGVRYDYQSIIWPVQSLDRVNIWNPRGAPLDMSMPNKSTPMKWNDITPRLGLIYDIFSDGTTLFKASYSRYVQPNQVGWINLAHPAGWFMWLTLIDPNTLQPFDWFTPIIVWAPGVSVNIGYKDHDLTAPYGDEITVGLERELWEDWSLGVRYIKKWEKNNIENVDAAHLNIDTLFDTGELEWIDYAPVNLTDPYSGNTYTFYNDMNYGRAPEQYIVNPPGADREYDGVELTLDKRYSRGWAVNLSYVYANSRGLIDTDRGSQSLGTSGFYENPNYHINRNGRFWLERRHQLKVTGLVKGPWGINLSGYFRWMSGNRRQREISSHYIASAPLNQTSQTIYATQRGAIGLPAQVLLDLRVEKAFKFGNVTLSLFADIFNVFNASTTIQYITNNSSHPRLNWLETSDIVDPRVLRLGAKVEF